ncbi:DUF5947 family protein [Amycolatopsis decaplanina]|uniref:Uncharacterized protein n=1 Tax=Amycolatopsis decaplanina DSM 44594 TaxID=1284240 RepID=M2YBK5_9PSEU|nr:DUF5947 family protein [Amycolatopsis decaplanina]EME52242.1 hypothetical protein H074_34051 [Amycolatopsis decaplanina DSM 44594]
MTRRAGLRRFVGPAEVAPASPRPSHPVQDGCELCAQPTGAWHGHVVDTEHRSILCTCRACFLLFTSPEAGGGRYRAVPDRYLHDDERPLTKAEWEGLGIPVGAAFLLRGDGGTTAFYPSPAGATECLLNLEALAELAAAHPLLAAAEPEVEAILIHATEDQVEAYLVPVDVCYRLVGTVRMYWKGFDGGQEAHEHIDGFFAGVRSAARRFGVEG